MIHHFVNLFWLYKIVAFIIIFHICIMASHSTCSVVSSQSIFSSGFTTYQRDSEDSQLLHLLLASQALAGEETMV